MPPPAGVGDAAAALAAGVVPSSREEVLASEGAAVAALLRDCDAFLFDCDGTLYQAGTLLPHISEAIGLLRGLGKKMFFVTNTSSRSREQLCAKLQGLGVPCQIEECVPSCVFSADYIRRSHPEAERVYVIGGSGVVDELAKVGIASSGGPAEDASTFSESDFRGMTETVRGERYDGVVVGWDTSLNYYKITKSSLVFQLHPDAFFYATNDDAADRVGPCLLPGNGPLLKAIEASCVACAPARVGREKPFSTEAVVLGKPNPDYARLIAEWNGVDLRRAVMVGDRLETDMVMANRAGMRALFVLTGVDDLAELKRQASAQAVSVDAVLTEVGALWTKRPAGAGVAGGGADAPPSAL